MRDITFTSNELQILAKIIQHVMDPELTDICQVLNLQGPIDFENEPQEIITLDRIAQKILG